MSKSTMASNNPFRTSMLATVPEPEHRLSTSSTLDDDRTTSRSPPALELDTLHAMKKPSDCDVIITINSASTDMRPSMAVPRPSVQADKCTMWPAHRQQEKKRISNKRQTMWIKVVIAVVIVVGAVALGLGITKAVRDAKRNDGQ